jgi:hypothetical protein
MMFAALELLEGAQVALVKEKEVAVLQHLIDEVVEEPQPRICAVRIIEIAEPDDYVASESVEP